jgi:class 3 adenylate cyclase
MASLATSPEDSSVELVQNLASYVPNVISRRLQQDVLKNENEKLPIRQAVQCICLFADVSGFTALSEKLQEEHGATAPQYLAKYLNSYVQQLVRLYAKAGGDVLKFAGDAQIVLFPIGDTDDPIVTTRRALQCALDVQKHQHKAQIGSIGSTVTLSVKIGIGIGTVDILHLGGAHDGALNRLEYCGTGTPLMEAFECEAHALPGAVVCNNSVYNIKCGGEKNGLSQYFEVCPAPKNDPKAICGDVDEWYDLLDKQKFSGETWSNGLIIRAVKNKQRVRSVNIGKVLGPLDSHNASLVPPLKSYCPRAITPFLSAHRAVEKYASELRSVSVMFVNLGFSQAELEIDFDEPMVQKIQHAFVTIQKIVFDFEGTINKFLIDDKGSTLLAVWGLPPLSHENDALRSLLASINICAQLKRAGLKSSIGITSGDAFCGICGHSGTRREYSVLGDVVNLSARLMGYAMKYGPQICCDEVTKSATRGVMHFEGLGKHKMKGKVNEVSIFSPVLRGLMGKKQNFSANGGDDFTMKKTTFAADKLLQEARRQSARSSSLGSIGSEGDNGICQRRTNSDSTLAALVEDENEFDHMLELQVELYEQSTPLGQIHYQERTARHQLDGFSFPMKHDMRYNEAKRVIGATFFLISEDAGASISNGNFFVDIGTDCKTVGDLRQLGLLKAANMSLIDPIFSESEYTITLRSTTDTLSGTMTMEQLYHHEDTSSETFPWVEISLRKARSTPAPLRENSDSLENALKTIYEAKLDLVVNNQGSLVILEGDAGTGKSHLLAEEFVLRTYEFADLVTCIAHGHPFNKGAFARKLGVWRTLLLELMHLELGVDEADISPYVLARINRERVEKKERSYSATELAVLDSWLGTNFEKDAALGAGKDHLSSIGISDIDEMASVSRLVVYLLKSYTKNAKLVFLIDEAMFMDDDSWAFTAIVAEAIPQILVVLSLRSTKFTLTGDEKASTRNSNQTNIHQRQQALLQLSRKQNRHVFLTPLDFRHIIRLVCELLLTDKLSPNVEKLLRRKAGGNPFIALELMASLKAEGFLNRVYQDSSNPSQPVHAKSSRRMSHTKINSMILMGGEFQNTDNFGQMNVPKAGRNRAASITGIKKKKCSEIIFSDESLAMDHVPIKIKSLFSSSLESLGLHATLLIKIAAVCGFEFPMSMVTSPEIFPIPNSSKKYLRGLVEALYVEFGLIVPTRYRGGRVGSVGSDANRNSINKEEKQYSHFEFQSWFVRDIVLSRITKDQKQEIQARMDNEKRKIQEEKLKAFTKQFSLKAMGSYNLTSIQSNLFVLKASKTYFTSSWKSRFCTLLKSPARVVQYYSAPDAGEEPASEIFLKGAMCESSKGSKHGKEYCFTLEASSAKKRGNFVSGKQMVYFAANSGRERDEWVMKLTVLIQKESGEKSEGQGHLSPKSLAVPKANAARTPENTNDCTCTPLTTSEACKVSSNYRLFGLFRPVPWYIFKDIDDGKLIGSKLSSKTGEVLAFTLINPNSSIKDVAIIQTWGMRAFSPSITQMYSKTLFEYARKGVRDNSPKSKQIVFAPHSDRYSHIFYYLNFRKVTGKSTADGGGGGRSFNIVRKLCRQRRGVIWNFQCDLV